MRTIRNLLLLVLVTVTISSFIFYRNSLPKADAAPNYGYVLLYAVNADPANDSLSSVLPGTPCNIYYRQSGSVNIVATCDFGVNTGGIVPGVQVAAPADFFQAINNR